MSSTTNFTPNCTRGEYHPDDRVNAVIRKGKNGSFDIYEMIDHLELLIGCKGLWKTQEIVNKYKNKSITFDQFVLRYLSLPKKYPDSEDNKDSTNDLRSKLWTEQAFAYNEEEGVPFSKDVARTVKRLIQRYLFRDCVFLSETKSSFERPNFVILDDKDREDASQSSTISDILFTRLGNSDYSITQKVHWWKTYNGIVYKHFSVLRSQVVRNMFSNFLQLYETEKKHNGPLPSNSTTDGSLPSSQDSLIETPLNLLIHHCDLDRALLADELLDLNIEKDAYRAFLDICAAAFFPKEKFKVHMRSHTLSKVLTETEEAFALLSLENNIDRWLWCAERGQRPDDDTVGSLPNLRYQENPSKRKDNRINGGVWKPAGRRRMNDLLEKVARVRTDRKVFEASLKDMYVMGCSSDEVASGWLRTENSAKKRSRENVAVKNCLSFVTKRAAI